MAKNLKAIGEVFDWPATSATTSGALVVIGALVGVALEDAEEGEVVAVRVEGVFDLPKAAGAIEQGARVYWNGSAIATSGDTFAGVAYEAAEADADIVSVKLNAAATAAASGGD